MAAIKSKNQKITTCLWFDNNAEEAVKYYLKVFKKSKKEVVSHYGEGAPLPAGKVLTVSFQIEGQEFLTMNGGPHFKINEAYKGSS